MFSFPRTFPVSESTINGAIAHALPEGSDVRAASLSLQAGLAHLSADVLHKGKPMSLKVPLAIEFFEVSKTTQRLVLRRMGKVEASAEGFFKQAMLATAGGLLGGVFSRSVMGAGLKDVAGVTLQGDLVTVDLSQMGLEGKLKQMVLEKLGLGGGAAEGVVASGEASGGFAQRMLEAAQRKIVEQLASRLAVTGAACEPGQLVLTVDTVKTAQEA